jgi:hypothetical protein
MTGDAAQDLFEMAAFIINSGRAATLDVRPAWRDAASAQRHSVSTRGVRLLRLCFYDANPVAITQIFIDG